MQTCSLLHKYSECYSEGFFNKIFFLPFLSSSNQKLQMLRKRRRIVGEPNSLGQAVVHVYRKLNAEIIACKAVKEVLGL